MANPMYGQNKWDNRLDADYDKKYNFKLYGIPVVSSGDPAHAVLAGTDDQGWTHTHQSGLVLSGNYVGANTVDQPPGHADGVEYSMTDTDNIGSQFTVGPFLAGGLEGYDIYTVGSSPAFYFKVHMQLTDVSGTDDCHVGFRLQSDAVETTGVGYSDFASLNIDAGAVKYENNLNGGTAATATATGTTLVDNEWAWLEVRVSAAGATSYYKNGTELTVNKPTFTFDTGDIITPWVYFRNATDKSDFIIDEVEFGLQ